MVDRHILQGLTKTNHFWTQTSCCWNNFLKNLRKFQIVIAWYCALFSSEFWNWNTSKLFSLRIWYFIIFPNSRIYPTVDWLSKNLPHCVWNEFQIAITYTHSVFLLGVPAVNFTSMWVAILVTERIVERGPYFTWYPSIHSKWDLRFLPCLYFKNKTWELGFSCILQHLFNGMQNNLMLILFNKLIAQNGFKPGSFHLQSLLQRLGDPMR